MSRRKSLNGTAADRVRAASLGTRRAPPWNQPPTPPPRPTLRRHRVRALYLRGLGYSFRAIADRLGVSLGTAHAIAR